jgi:hypothetical protein
MPKETESIRALAAEATETLELTRMFNQCIVKDPRTASGFFKIASDPVPKLEKELKILEDEERSKK